MGLSVGNENALLAINSVKKSWYDFIYITLPQEDKIMEEKEALRMN
jgi:hypothetical protein